MSSRSSRALKALLDDDEAEPAQSDTPLNFEPVKPRVQTLDDVIGLDELKDELRLQLQVWANSEGLAELGGKARIGFIFSGPTGSGKTTSAHALAAETGKELFVFSGTDFQNGDGRDRLVEMIETLHKRDAIVFIDESDDLLHKRDFRMERSGPLVKTLLVNLDQTTRDVKAFFIFATNMHPQGIDDALLSAHRLGRPLIFRHLRQDERVLLLERHRDSYRVDPGVILGPIASQMGDIPTANLAYLFDEGAFVAFRRGHACIDQSDLQEAAQRLRSGLEKRKDWLPDELYRVAAHEAGHTIVQLLNDKRWDTIGFVQVSQRLEGNDGTTHGNDETIDRAWTAERVVRHIGTSFGGRVAETILTGSYSSGCEGDLTAANRLADKASADWAFGKGDLALRVTDHDRYWNSKEQEDAWNQYAAMLLNQGMGYADTVLMENLEALKLLTDKLVTHRVADSATLKGWLGHLLSGVE